MSVVAGCLLFDGVLLASDCRVTFLRPGSREVYVDYAQKIFPVVPGTAIGFVGDVRIASILLGKLFSQVEKRRNLDPISVAAWMQRLFRRLYGNLQSSLRGGPIAFMVASAFHNRLNVVERSTVVDLVRRIGFGHSPVQRSWMPGILIEILKTPPEVQLVAIPGTTRGALYIMRPPDFNFEPCRPLHFAAIGSGEGVFTEIAQLHDMIVAGEPGNFFMEATWFTEAIQIFVRDNNVRSVGGLYPVLKVRGRDIEFLGMRQQIPVGGTTIELINRNGRLIQRNATTGKEIQLLYPWEIPLNETQDRVFDDLEEAYRNFSSPDPAQ